MTVLADPPVHIDAVLDHAAESLAFARRLQAQVAAYGVSERLWRR